MSEDTQTPQASPPPAPTPQQPAAPTPDQRTWAMLCHLAALAALVGIPFGNVVGPLVVWLIKRNEMPIVDSEGRKSLNFQITMAIAGFVAFMTVFVFIGFLLLPAVAIFDLVFVIIASVKASKGEPTKYPFAIQFLK